MITIPKQHYVGLRSQHESKDLPLAFVTPYDDHTTKAFTKRKSTVDSWMNAYVHSKNPKQTDTQIVDNELLSGYKIAEEIRRIGWGSGNVVWRMVDPRGWEFEISSSNLARILDCTTIKNGTIEDRCLFGREKGQNILLPEHSEPHQDAIQNTERSNVKIKLKDVNPGATVVLKDGREGIFLGRYDVASTDAAYTTKVDYYYSNQKRPVTHRFTVIQKRYFFKETVTESSKKARNLWSDEVGDVLYSASSNIHISEVLCGVVTDKEFNKSEIAEEITNWLTSHTRWDNLSHAYLVSDKPLTNKLKIKQVPFAYRDLAITVSNRSDSKCEFVIIKNGQSMQRVTSSRNSMCGTNSNYYLSAIDDISIDKGTVITSPYDSSVHLSDYLINNGTWTKIVVEFDNKQYDIITY